MNIKYKINELDSILNINNAIKHTGQDIYIINKYTWFFVSLIIIILFSRSLYFFVINGDSSKLLVLGIIWFFCRDALFYPINFLRSGFKTYMSLKDRIPGVNCGEYDLEFCEEGIQVRLEHIFDCVKWQAFTGFISEKNGLHIFLGYQPYLFIPAQELTSEIKALIEKNLHDLEDKSAHQA